MLVNMSPESLEKVCEKLPPDYFRLLEAAASRMQEAVRVVSSGEASEKWLEDEMNGVCDTLAQAGSVHAMAAYFVGMCEGIRIAERPRLLLELDEMQ